MSVEVQLLNARPSIATPISVRITVRHPGSEVTLPLVEQTLMLRQGTLLAATVASGVSDDGVLLSITVTDGGQRVALEQDVHVAGGPSPF